MQAAELTTVSIVIPTYRRPEVLSATLQELLKVDYPREAYEVIVVDDGSADHTPTVVATAATAHSHVKYVHQENAGVATARNRGAREAKGELLIFLDDDMVVEPTFIQRHLATQAAFGPSLVNGHWEFYPPLVKELARTPFGRFRMRVERWVKTGTEHEPLTSACTRPSTITACNLGIWGRDFWAIGGFDEAFPYAGCEDQEFSIRAAAAGYNFVYNREILFWHNDQRLTLRQFCERQRRGAMTAVLLAAKHGRSSPMCSTVELNLLRGPATLGARLRNRVKSLGSCALSLALVHVIIGTLEKIAPVPALLDRLYWSACGLYIFRGVRDGCRVFGEPNLPPIAS